MLRDNGRPAVFLDRDGVINVDTGYVSRAEDLVLCQGAPEALQSLRRLGFALVVVTNQSGIARGLFTAEEYEAVNDALLAMLRIRGIELDAVYSCPHHPDFGNPPVNCPCRKPAPGMIRQALQDFDLDARRSWLIGDKESDVSAGQAAGVAQTIRISLVDVDTNADFTCRSLADAASLIEQRSLCSTTSDQAG